MRKVLVTGAGGFIGSHLCELLVERGYQVRAFVRYGSAGTCGWLEQSTLRKEFDVVAGDIRDYDSVSRAARGVDLVFHLAALIGIPYSYESPLAYVKTNVEGTYNVLEACRRAEVRRVLVTSTSEVYGSARYTPIDEAHPLQPQSPYSATKIAADQLALSYFNAFGLPVVVARPFNTFGPRQSTRAIIPTIAVQLLARRTKVMLGSLDPVRDFTYVRDTATGLLTIALSDQFVGSCVNIGTGSAVSIRELYEQISDVVGYRAELAEDAHRIRPRASEVTRLLSNNERLRSASDWHASFTLQSGLEQTVEWLRDRLHLYDPERYTV